MTDFSRPLSGFRFADTSRGDTLQKIAARELGDATRWPELISYNRLVPPFITDDAALAGPGVLLSGQPILVPAPAGSSLASTDANEVLGADVLLDRYGDLATDGVDFVVVSGADNMTQALTHRVRTERGELVFHPGYGCDARRMIGKANGPTKGLIAAQLAKASISEDPRVSRVTAARAQVQGDVLRIEVNAETIAGQAVQAAANV